MLMDVLAKVGCRHTQMEDMLAGHIRGFVYMSLICKFMLESALPSIDGCCWAPLLTIRLARPAGRLNVLH